jgi:transposase-like protein
MQPKEFRYRHFVPEVIRQCLRWYLRYPISYHQLEEMVYERGIEVDHTTIYRWIQHYAPEFEKRILER